MGFAAELYSLHRMTVKVRTCVTFGPIPGSVVWLPRAISLRLFTA